MRMRKFCATGVCTSMRTSSSFFLERFSRSTNFSAHFVRVFRCTFEAHTEGGGTTEWAAERDEHSVVRISQRAKSRY